MDSRQVMGHMHYNIFLNHLWAAHQTKTIILNLNSGVVLVQACKGNMNSLLLHKMWNTKLIDTEAKLILPCILFPTSFCVSKLAIHSYGQAQHFSIVLLALNYFSIFRQEYKQWDSHCSTEKEENSLQKNNFESLTKYKKMYSN